MISVLRVSLGTQTALRANKNVISFFKSFVVLCKQKKDEDAKHMHKQTIISQNRQSILKDRTRKAYLAILEILKACDNFLESKTVWSYF